MNTVFVRKMASPVLLMCVCEQTLVYLVLCSRHLLAPLLQD